MLNPLQYSCLENPMDKGVWQATVYRVAKSQTRPSDFYFHFQDGLMTVETCRRASEQDTKMRKREKMKAGYISLKVFSSGVSSIGFTTLP